MEFLDIPLMINGNVQYFDFRRSDVFEDSTVFRITSMGKEALVNANYTVETSNMPEGWLVAAIAQLKLMIASKDFNP